MDDTISFLIYSKTNRLIKVIHKIENLKECAWRINWSKVEIWKYGQCQNVVTDVYDNKELIGFAEFYIAL